MLESNNTFFVTEETEPDDCKRALDESSGDIQYALHSLRCPTRLSIGSLHRHPLTVMTSDPELAHRPAHDYPDRRDKQDTWCVRKSRVHSPFGDSQARRVDSPRNHGPIEITLKIRVLLTSSSE